MLTQLLLTIGVAMVVTQVAVFATTIHLHRAATHRAIALDPLVAWLCKFILWITTGQRTREWVAVHRKHHTFTDQEGDPHSPRLLGFWKVQLGNVYYYVKATKDPDILVKYAPDVEEGLWDRKVFNHGRLGIFLGTVALCALMGVGWGLAGALMHTVMYMAVIAPLINGLGHWSGQKNFGNTAYNQPGLSWFTGGEALHNNHHAHPRSPKFSMRRFEFDPSWPVIRALAAVRLVTVIGAVVRLP
ncbi:MAG: fatty acid desaturase [Parcubacteria group bacterium]